MGTFCILSADPGTANYGYAAIHSRLKKGRVPVYEIKKTGRILTTIREIKSDFQSSLQDHVEVLQNLREEFQPTHFIAERYMSRRLGGTTIELVNMMLGIASLHFQDLSMKLIPASQWKNAAKRNGIDLEDLYREGKTIPGVTNHAVDACMIAIFGSYILTGVKEFHQFDCVDFLSQIEKCDKEDIQI